MQNDGNFVVYVSRVLVSRNILWQTNSVGFGTPGTRQVTLYNSGNLALHSGTLEKWSSGSAGGVTPHRLVMQDDGNLVLYGGDNQVRWQSNTVRN